MSADLFAEFNDLADNPPPPPAQAHPSPFHAQPQLQSQPPPQAAPKDPFDFFNAVGHASPATTQPVQAAQPWPTFQSQPVSTSPWGNVSAPSAPAAPSKPPVVMEEDDDGWGDFEVAEPKVPAPAPAPIHAPAVVAGPSISSSISWQSPTQHAAPASSISPSISWQSPAQYATPAPSISPSIAWQSPAQATTPAPSISPSIAWQSPAPVPVPQPTTSQELPARTRVVRASTLDLMSNNLVDTSGLPQQPSGPSWGQRSTQQFDQQPAHEAKLHSRMKPRIKVGPTDPNVLFDAEDFELQVPEGDEDEDDDDEFGDFETVPPPPPPKPAPSKPAPSKPTPVKTYPPPPSMDLLSLDDPVPPPPQPAKGKPPPSQLLGTLAFGSAAINYPQAPRSPSYQDRNPFPELAIKTPTGPAPEEDGPKSASPVTAWPTLDSAVEVKPEKYKDEDEGWGAWDDFPANDSKNDGKRADVDSAAPPESWDWDAVDNVQPSKPKISGDAPPPTNVPPPSVILSVFPELLNTGDALFKPISGQNASIKQRILSDPKAVDFLEAYVLLATTAARVIAGRKQRWHRDKILAKSMSISAAGSKGMKLAGVDKTQSAREDREAADVAAVWRGQVGRLRSAVAAAKAAGKVPTLRVPEISETIPVHTAKLVPTAPKACIICGLKREERVAKVDIEVEDSFGEWWADHWGHKACKNFWIEHEQMLRQR
ncbi:hypothetical protein G7Z17_g13591 [Cylindrodendrum hubeiense]|uniref:Serine/threonine-protein kinase ppk6 n=1 Tax=Cylindrodendrum hubeiense TaxID=595255 RepID=A0A9P5GWS4_9HYPO|nr:hypothetical protein G7Z17_g13591 [Cylindrodendrum hubeiense]